MSCFLKGRTRVLVPGRCRILKARLLVQSCLAGRESNMQGDVIEWKILSGPSVIDFFSKVSLTVLSWEAVGVTEADKGRKCRWVFLMFLLGTDWYLSIRFLRLRQCKNTGNRTVRKSGWSCA